MYKIATRTKRVVLENIETLQIAIAEIKRLESKAKANDDYRPGYYRIEKT